MGLKYCSNEFNNSKKISLLTSNIDIPIYLNDKKYQSSSETYTSLRNYHGIHYPLQKNIYANISKLPSDIFDDTSYATLVNTTSINAPILDENNNNNRIYENLKLQSINNTSSSSSSSSSLSPIYINLNDPEDLPPVIPPSLRKTDQKEEIEINVIEKCSTSKTKQVS
jgi:hypothetical protein